MPMHWCPDVRTIRLIEQTVRHCKKKYSYRQGRKAVSLTTPTSG
ncbi:hypothetical protein [Parabacteroides goldsteinii]|nr:hypothetical protein [Parabacteroides goldsteinii]